MGIVKLVARNLLCNISHHVHRIVVRIRIEKVKQVVDVEEMLYHHEDHLYLRHLVMPDIILAAFTYEWAQLVSAFNIIKILPNKHTKYYKFIYFFNTCALIVFFYYYFCLPTKANIFP